MKLVSVKLNPVGRALVLPLGDLPPEHTPQAGEPVIVQTETGTALGTVVRSIPQIVARAGVSSVSADAPRHVVRVATHADVVTRLKHEQREKEAARIAQMKIRERGLAMKLSRVEQSFDGLRLVFYFTAEGRVDFRDLVRDLAAEFRTRIEMHQIGVRDEAKALGGYGTCGRPLCCTTFLTSFEPVSIKMAKRQNLSLNPSKLSGLCGRLKCCLRYELPNAAGNVHGGCGSEGGCDNPTGCGSGGCGSAGCGSGQGGSCGRCGSSSSQPPT